METIAGGGGLTMQVIPQAPIITGLDTPQQEILAVGEGLGGGDDDTVARVDTQRVKILHVADSNTVVLPIPHHLAHDVEQTLSISRRLGTFERPPGGGGPHQGVS